MNSCEHYTKCKHYTKHLDTIRAYISCLYAMHNGEFCTGGLLHIVTDDGNLEDHHIQWCLDKCEKHPEREDSEIGKLICKELLKLPMEQRKLIYFPDWLREPYCNPNNCEDCPIQNDEVW